MKKLIVLALLIPSLSFAQRFEITEQAGGSQTTSLTNNQTAVSGFSNQVSVGYRPIKHFSVSAFYELNNWNTHNDCFGLAPDFVTKHFYAGLDLIMAKYTAITNEDLVESENFKTSFGYGLHIGAKQKIYKRLSVIEQVGYDLDEVKANRTSNPGGVAITVHSAYTETLHIWYLRAGLSYRI
jgi:hypothetical protein